MLMMMMMMVAIHLRYANLALPVRKLVPAREHGPNWETGAFQMGVPPRNSTCAPGRAMVIITAAFHAIPNTWNRSVVGMGWSGVEISRVCPSRFLIIGYHNRLITRLRSLRDRAVLLVYFFFY